MKLLGALALIAVLVIPAQSVHAQAFGIEMGQKPEDLRVLSRPSAFRLKVAPPKPHPEFESYTAIIGLKTGVCAVVATGKTHENDRHGKSVKRSFNEIETALLALYGAAKKYDFIKSGALWGAENEWVMSIEKNERSYASFWVKDGLPKNLESLSLRVFALNPTDSWIVLRYDFKNLKACEEERDASAPSGL